MKFNEIIQEESPIFTNPSLFQIFSPNHSQCQIDLSKPIALQQIYQYSHQNVKIAQQMPIIQSNFIHPHQSDTSLRQSRELDAQSYRVPRNFFVRSIDERQSIRKSIGDHFAESTRPATPLKAIQTYESLLQVRNSLGHLRKDNESQRISIFLDEGRSPYDAFDSKFRGPIPLHENTKNQSLVVKTYRQVKNRFDKSYEKLNEPPVKQKVQIKKEQNSRFKGSLIAYDYNGEPILLKSNRKNTVYQIPVKPQESVLISALAENIVLPSTINKTRLQKRKARYILDDLKQNQRGYPQIAIIQSSEFLKITPKEIDKLRLFKAEQSKQDTKKSFDQLSFSEFKKNMKCLRNTRNCSVEFKQTKTKLLGTNILKDDKKGKRSLKRVNLNNGKMTLNQQAFERIFNFIPGQQNILYEQGVAGNLIQFKDDIRVHRQNLSQAFNRHHKNSERISKKKNVAQSVHILGMNNLTKIQRSLRKQILKPFQKQQNTSIWRNSLNNSPQKGRSLYKKQKPVTISYIAKPIQNLQPKQKEAVIESKQNKISQILNQSQHRETNKSNLAGKGFLEGKIKLKARLSSKIIGKKLNLGSIRFKLLNCFVCRFEKSKFCMFLLRIDCIVLLTNNQNRGIQIMIATTSNMISME